MLAGGDQHAARNGDSGLGLPVYAFWARAQASSQANHGMMLRSQMGSPYMEFAKLRSSMKYNLATNGIISYPLADAGDDRRPGATVLDPMATHHWSSALYGTTTLPLSVL
jgi:hypothetical protein